MKVKELLSVLCDSNMVSIYYTGDRGYATIIDTWDNPNAVPWRYADCAVEEFNCLSHSCDIWITREDLAQQGIIEP